MTALEWDKTGERYYETGTSKGVLYPMNDGGNYETGVAWNGLTGITESPSGADVTDLWADNSKYASLRAAETFGGTIEAYTYPDEWEVCDGSAQLAKGVTIGQQPRKAFGLCYRTEVSNDTGAEDYKLHLVYGATASPSEKAYTTINDSPDAITFSWEFTTTPVNVTGAKPTSVLIIDTSRIQPEDKTKLETLEKKLYGDLENEPKLLTPDEVKEIFSGE